MFQTYRPPRTATRQAVRFRMAGGRIETGAVDVPAGQSVHDMMNDAAPFVACRRTDGTEVLVNKALAEVIEVLPAVAADPLARALARAEQGDASSLLGVAPDASASAVRAAYHAMAQRYHPDRFSGLGLPDEVVAYATAMFARINAAYRELQERAGTSRAEA